MSYLQFSFCSNERSVCDECPYIDQSSCPGYMPLEDDILKAEVDIVDTSRVNIKDTVSLRVTIPSLLQ